MQERRELVCGDHSVVVLVKRVCLAPHRLRAVLRVEDVRVDALVPDLHALYAVRLELGLLGFRVSASQSLQKSSPRGVPGFLMASVWSSSPSTFDSLESEVSLSSFLFLDMDDFNLLTTHFLISSLDTRVFSSFGILFRG